MLPLHSQMKNGSLEKVKRYNKFIEKTDFYTVQEASTEKYNLSRSVNFFAKLLSVSIKLEIYINYTMKSLILAQDER